MDVVFATIPRFYTALAQWLSVMVFVLVYHRQRRLKGPLLWGTALLGLALLIAELMLTDDIPLVWWLPAMLGAVALMYGLLWVCCDIPPAGVGYCCTRAFLMSELATSLAWQIYYFYSSSNALPVPGVRVSNLLLIIPILLIALLQWQLERSYSEGGRCDPVTGKELVSVLIIGVVAFAISNLSFINSDSPFTSSFAREIYNIRTLVDLGGVAILYAYHIQHRELHMRYELDAMNSVLENQYVQYRQSRESIDLINRKYHDLKHQIAALRAEPDAQRREAWLDAMESDIAVYEAQNKTGNSVLDTVLTGKSLYCQKHGVSLTCVADGSRLGFMDVMDICNIFGNLLDNAIEAVLRVKDKEKRLIHLTVSAERSFLLIRTENYFEGEVSFKNGLPQSTKGDDRFHGFGVKSIRQAAGRYGGTVTITARHNWFEVKILLPLPEEKSKN